VKHDELADVYCSVARTWAVIGERWTMLILRECFRGERRYDHFRSKRCASSTTPAVTPPTRP